MLHHQAKYSDSVKPTRPESRRIQHDSQVHPSSETDHNNQAANRSPGQAHGD